MTLLDVDDLSVEFGRRTILDRVHLSVEGGTFAALIGPNGAGKSTLLRAILEIVPHSSGHVSRNAPIAYVPQGDHARLDLPLTALDVVMMGRFRQTPWCRPTRRSDRAAARSALVGVGMEAHAACQIGELSGGQRQRIMIARALAQDASVLLLDEPLTGVDSSSGAFILSLLRALCDDGRAVVMSTHDLNQAARECDRLIFLNGRVVADGPPSETFTPDVLRATYGGDLFVSDVDGAPMGVFDDASHHHHALGGGHAHHHERHASGGGDQTG
ncbi:MAG: metal ABC transporter ATP-binding protein [Actinobacteria bacterium]|nr:metal ABC transporter ATP-binding protein [Actinomycetota bacterium]